MEREIKFNFEDLKVYQKSLDFIDETYKITKRFPKEETYGLQSQYRRAAVSIALNIAEGAGDTNAQFNRFLKISNGSIKECVVCSTIANRLNFIDQKQNYQSRLRLEELSKMNSSLQKYLKNNSNSSND